MRVNNNTNKVKFSGALLQCLNDFPLFRDDYRFFVEHGIIKPILPDRCEWAKSKTSLAEYFRWIGFDAGVITGGFWAPIEKAFNIKKGTLRKLAGNNANPLKPEQSKDFIKIKETVLQYREDSDFIRERKVFQAIKKIVNDTKDEDPEIIHAALIQTQNIFKKNCGQKNSKRITENNKEIQRVTGSTHSPVKNIFLS